MEEASENLYKSLKDDPEEIIIWAEKEIKLYKELIKLLKSKKK